MSHRKGGRGKNGARLAARIGKWVMGKGAQVHRKKRGVNIAVIHSKEATAKGKRLGGPMT